jgi:hypothetical protein
MFQYLDICRLVYARNTPEALVVVNMPQLCVAAYGRLEGMWLPTSGHCCLSSITYIGDSRYLDMISINAVIINAYLCSHSEQCIVFVVSCLG